MPSARDAADRPELSVVLSTLGNYPVLKRVLDAYERQDAPAGSFEVLVVSDSKEPDLDAVDAAVGDRSFPVRRLVGGRPGLSANRNRGWTEARAPVVLFTDNDTIPVRRLVSEHIAWHREHPAIEVVVVGHVRWARGLKVTPFMKWLDHGMQFDFHSLRGDQGTWAHVYGANSSIKRAFLERVGGYDEERLPYLYEDLDWGYRARQFGVRVLYNRRAVVDHWRPVTLDVWRTRAPQLAATEWQFVQKHPEVEPWFYRKFSWAAEQPPSGQRAVRLTPFVPRWVPWLGRRVWEPASLFWLQQIAPAFLRAWEEASSATGRSPLPDVEALLAERARSSGSAQA
jgi:GT2 family glycosyltransferase